MNDPLSIWNTRIRLTMILGAIAILGCAAWAFVPLARTTHPPSPIELQPPSPSPIITTKPPFATDAFSVKLWPHTNNPSPRNPVLTPPTHQTSPLHLDLISIIQEEQGLRAALYDSNQNKLVIVQSGDLLPPFTVSAITETAVELQRGSATHLLPLRGQSP